MDYVFLDVKEKHKYIGIVEDQRLVEFYLEDKAGQIRVGDIYRARVENVVRAIDSAFVNIGGDKNGFLYSKDALPRELMYDGDYYHIDQCLRAGEDVIVQVLKEGEGKKGPKLTRHISIPGNNIVLTPYSNRINVSRKIPEDRNLELRSWGKEIEVEGIGFIIRTNAIDIGKEELRMEYNSLLDLYRKLSREKNYLPIPKLIYRDLDVFFKLISNYKYRDYKIILNDRKSYDLILDYDQSFLNIDRDKLILEEDFNIKYNREIMSGLSQALSRKINLESGGSIVIDRTEAMTVIDVNSGASTSEYNLSDTVIKTNFEAAREIARQIRLRDLVGIILIDFIDFRDKSYGEKLLDEFSKELSRDLNRANIIDITRLGLVELTRKKTRNSDLDIFKKTCSECGQDYIDINVDID